MINRFTVSAILVTFAAFAQAAAEEQTIVTRKEQPYVAIKTTVAIKDMPIVLPKLIPQLYGWLHAHKVIPAGAQFIRYTVIDMAKGLDIEIGVPVAKTVSGDSRVTPGILPAGKYASLTHFGNYNGLMASNAQLQRWGMSKGLTWKMQKTERGEEWAGRLEVYKTEPHKEPDPGKWETEILYLVADANRRK